MRLPRTTIRRLSLAIFLIAADLASVRGSYDINLLVAVPVLQVGLFRVLTPEGSIRPFWVGFGVFGWAGVLALICGVGPLWFGYLDGQLNAAITRISEGNPAAGRALAMLIFCEGTSMVDTLPGLLPVSLLAGLPVLILAGIGGKLSEFLASRSHSRALADSGREASHPRPAMLRRLPTQEK